MQVNIISYDVGYTENNKELILFNIFVGTGDQKWNVQRVHQNFLDMDDFLRKKHIDLPVCPP